VIVDLCVEGCGGVWLDADDMRHGRDLREALDDHLQGPSRVSPSIVVDRAAPADCPVCGERMRRYRWNYTSRVVLDQCPKGHGSWLDGGELAEMQEAHDLEVLDPQEQARVKARMELARLEIQGRLRAAGSSARAPRLGVTLLNAVWDRYQ
jgi:Zn-finger nucleic acid-binding protein